MKIAIRECDNVRVVDQDDILYCKAEGRYTHIFIRHDKSILTSHLLKEIESALSDYCFCRIHNSYLINLNHISTIKKHKMLVLKNGVELPIAKRRNKLLIEHIEKLDIDFI